MSSEDIVVLRPGDNHTRGFDFTTRLPTGRTLASGVLTCVDTLDDSEQNALLDSTTASISSSIAGYQFDATSAKVGHDYLVKLIATLDNGETLDARVLIVVR